MLLTFSVGLYPAIGRDSFSRALKTFSALGVLYGCAPQINNFLTYLLTYLFTYSAVRLPCAVLCYTSDGVNDRLLSGNDNVFSTMSA